MKESTIRLGRIAELRGERDKRRLPRFREAGCTESGVQRQASTAGGSPSLEMESVCWYHEGHGGSRWEMSAHIVFFGHRAFRLAMERRKP